ncbi:MAG: hypothetical protein ACOCYT_04670 [Chloroflexota bacterium]
MKTNRIWTLLLFILAGAIVAGVATVLASGGGNAQPAAESAALPADSLTQPQSEQDEDLPLVLPEDIERPDWQQIALRDVNTGETFTLGDFYGEAVFVEPMATWCSNCRSQLRNVASTIPLLEEAGVDNVRFIALSVELTLDDTRLARYTQDNGFEWTFAVMPEDLLVQLIDQYGRSIGNPPSTPHFIIRPDGTTTDLSTGIDTPEQLVTMIEEALATSAPTTAPDAVALIGEAAPEATPEPTPEATEAAALDIERRPWQTFELTDARTGETFTLADFDGQTVYVEPMATWCSNCRAQLRSVSEALTRLEADGAADDIMFIALSVESTLNPEQLADYADDNSFDWTFAVAPIELVGALIDDFGRSIANPPATPHFIIRPDGTFTSLITGRVNPDGIIDLLDEAQASGSGA